MGGKAEQDINNKNGKERMKEGNGKKKDIWDQTHRCYSRV